MRFQNAAPVVLGISLIAPGCRPPHPDEQEPDGPEPIGTAVLAATVAEAASAGCSTASVKGLSLQIIAQAACLAPGSFVEVPPPGNLTFTEAVLPYLEQPAKDALLAALASEPAQPMQINSMLRTVAQQYLLYTWYLEDKCGIALAAKPGASNHETGLALDVQQYDAWKSTLTAHGFAWYGADDPVHYDYVGPGAIDYKGTDVLAFQVLWNKNHPDDLIDEDGLYGPQTEGRLKQSPAEGFAIGPDCSSGGPAPDIHPAVSSVDFTDVFGDGASTGRLDAFVGDLGTVEITLKNQGEVNATNVDLGIESASPHLAVLDYFIETDFGTPGSFKENDANTAPANPVHGSDLGSSFALKMNGFSKGESKRVTLTVRADVYSIEKDAAPELRFWVKDVPGAYHQDAYGGPAENVNGSQTFNGGVLEVAAPMDVYSSTQWLWNTDRREGWEAMPAGQIAADPDRGVLVLTGDGSGPWAQSAPLSLSAEALPYIEVTGHIPEGGNAFLYFMTEAAPEISVARRFPLKLPAGESPATSVIDASENASWKGTLTGLSLRVEGGGALEVDSLRLLPEPDDGEGGSGGGGSGGSGAGAGDGDSEGVSCSCRVPGAPESGSGEQAAFAAALLGLAGLLSRRRRSPRPR